VDGGAMLAATAGDCVRSLARNAFEIKAPPVSAACSDKAWLQAACEACAASRRTPQSRSMKLASMWLRK